MRTFLVIEGAGHDPEIFRKLLEEHGYKVSGTTESAWQVEQALYASEKRYRHFFENAPLGIFRATHEMQLLAVNPALVQMFKYDSQDQMIADINRHGFRQTLCVGEDPGKEVLAQVRQSSSWQQFEGRYRCRDGSFIDCSVRLCKVDDCPDQIEGFIEDITERRQADEALRFTQYVVDHTTDQAFWITEDARVFYANEAACRALGYSREELVGMSIFDFDPAYPAEEFFRRWKQVRTLGSYTIESVHRARDGRSYPVEVRVNHVEFGGREYHCVFITDITERKAAEQSLRQSRERLRQVMKMLPIAAYTTDAQGRITFYNRCAAELWGRRPDPDRDRWSGAYRLRYPDGSPMACAESPMAMTLEKGRRFQGQEMLVDREQGGMSHVIAYPEPLYDSAGNLIGAVNLLVDITERKTAEQRLKASLEEKEVLLKEIHHRVKNNLQVVSSLLYLQSQKIEDPEVRALFAESQNRICSMALAHEQLYQSKSLADISLREYVHSLVSHMRQVNMLPESRIECEVLVADVTVDIEKVVPCGLLITELFSNAIKHAFPDGRRGMVRIEISSRQRDVKLSVADDGVGLPAGFDYRHTQTLGLQLVCALVAQLDGDISLVGGAGTRFDIIFPVGSP